MIDFLRRLFGLGPKHPALLWEALPTPLPMVDLVGGAVGSLALGQPSEAARFLGRPDEVREHGQFVILSYAARGFELIFVGDVFDELRVFLSHAEPSPTRGTCEPTLSNGGRLTASATPASIRAALGPASYDDEDEGDTLLIYEQGALAYEFEFEEGQLRTWSLARNQ